MRTMKLNDSAEAMRKLRKKRQLSGMCMRCKKPSASSLCHDCSEQLRSYKKPKEKKAFRTPAKWQVSNHSLYNYMTEQGITAKQLAQMVNVSERTVLRWVFERSVPKEPVRSRVEALLQREVF